MELVVLGLLAFAVYKFFRTMTKLGLEGIRAYVFLENLKRGVSPTEASTLTHALLTSADASLENGIIETAKHAITAVHDGKQLPLIGYAYRNGLQPLTPSWYAAIARSFPPTAQVEACYGAANSKASVPVGGTDLAEARAPGFETFYEVYANEVHRLTGKSSDEIRMADLMEDEPLRRAWRDGVDPLFLATAYCDAHGITQEVYPTFASYYDAFKSELSRYAGKLGTGTLSERPIDDESVREAFAGGVHPRRVAYELHQSHVAR